MVALAIFLMAVYGLASALTVLKFGRYFFGVGYCGGKNCYAADCTKEEPCKKEGHPKEHRKFVGKLPFFGDIFYCPPCISFYIGMAVSVWFLSPSSLVVPIWWKAMVLDGLSAVAFSYLAHVTAERLTHGLDV
jgi:hypothetical protein